MKKNIDLIIDGIAPEKVMYDTDNHSLVVLYPAQGEFKRGDVLKSKCSDAIFILDAISPKHEDEEWCSSIIGLNFQGILVQRDTYCWGSIHNARLGTPEEQQILFDALKKEGKKWNPETLQVEYLDISEIVVDLESARKYLRIGELGFSFSVYNLVKGSRESKYFAQITLQLICEAWNKFDKFEIDWNDIEQEKYAPYRYAGSSDLYAVNSSNWLGFESLIVFKSTERALQFGTQFKELFKTAMGL